MSHDHGGRAQLQRAFGDDPRIHAGPVDGPLEQVLGSEYAMTGIQKKPDEDFLPGVSQATA